MGVGAYELGAGCRVSGTVSIFSKREVRENRELRKVLLCPFGLRIPFDVQRYYKWRVLQQ